MKNKHFGQFALNFSVAAATVGVLIPILEPVSKGNDINGAVIGLGFMVALIAYLAAMENLEA